MHHRQHTLLTLLVLLAFSQQPTCSGMLEHPTQHLQDITEFLPYCKFLAASLTPADLTQLRGLVQLVHGHQKRDYDLAELIQNNEKVPTDPKLKHAFKTNKTLAELRAEADANRRVTSEQSSKAEQLIQSLKAAQRLPGNASFPYVSQCVSSQLDFQLYPYRPTVSFLLQYFKRPHVISEYVARLMAVVKQQGLAAELVVNVDNVHEHKEWAELSYSTNGFVVPVFSANVHEARAYNRIAEIARGDILVLLQDDDLPPVDTIWVKHLVQVFGKYPKTGAVGMMSYRYCLQGEGGNRYQGDFYFQDPGLNLKVQFASVVDFAPLAVRKAAFEAVGGLDEGMSDKGECGIYGDWELTTRMWVAGWQVMYMELSGKEPDQKAKSGTHLPETADRCWGRQASAAGAIFHERFDAVHPTICSLVQQLNVEHLQPLDPSRPCPFKDGKCSKAG